MEENVPRSESLASHYQAAKSRKVSGMVKASLCLTSLLTTALPALAVDGCLVLLCFAAPNWRAIPQCVPPIQQVLRDLARGKPFPACASAGPVNTASHRWSSAPSYCPPQYTHAIEGENGVLYTCDYTGAVSVMIEGSPWARTWWSMSGDTVTEYTPAAKARLGTWQTRFDDDHAAWLATLPPSAPSCFSC